MFDLLINADNVFQNRAMLAESEAEKKGSTIEVEKSKCSKISIAHVTEYPSMHHFGIARNTQSVITYDGLTK